MRPSLFNGALHRHKSLLIRERGLNYPETTISVIVMLNDQDCTIEPPDLKKYLFTDSVAIRTPFSNPHNTAVSEMGTNATHLILVEHFADLQDDVVAAGHAELRDDNVQGSDVD